MHALPAIILAAATAIAAVSGAGPAGAACFDVAAAVARADAVSKRNGDRIEIWHWRSPGDPDWGALYYFFAGADKAALVMLHKGCVTANPLNGRAAIAVTVNEKVRANLAAATLVFTNTAPLARPDAKPGI